MGKKSYFISLILLVLFGVGFLSETTPGHTMPINPKSLISQDHVEKWTLHTTTAVPDRSHPIDNTGECSDPCHAGSCHFGHCSYLVKVSSNAAPLVLVRGRISFERLIPLSTPLEGPERPPRLA